MTHRTLRVVFDAGDRTCASAPGTFCRFLRTKRFGSVFVCHLFGGKELQDETGKESGPGWLQRLPECLVAEREGGL